MLNLFKRRKKDSLKLDEKSVEKTDVEKIVEDLVQLVKVIREDQEKMQGDFVDFRKSTQQLSQIVLRNAQMYDKMTSNDSLVVLDGEEFLIEKKYKDWLKMQLENLRTLRKKAQIELKNN